MEMAAGLALIVIAGILIAGIVHDRPGEPADEAEPPAERPGGAPRRLDRLDRLSPAAPRARRDR